jgi:serine/threonine protein kinase/tetratricopeptide (TPR) repeat protein
MDAERRKKAEALFHEAFELPLERRAEFLRERCGADTALWAEVEALLACSEAEIEDFMGTPSFEPAAPDDPLATSTSVGGAAAPPDVPARIGPFRCIRALGRGGMGSVILAVQEDQQFKRRVALKLLRRGMDTADILRRFALERQVLGALNHPNIARLLDAGQTADGRPYFVMEYIEGRPIDEYCDAENLPVDDRLTLFRKVCSAVHTAHQNLVVHRDLKPGNILVTAQGEPKLLDFGIAKLLNPDLFQVTALTGPELRLMTPEYASPEQVQGQPISITSDVYSLGVLLYELLSGHRPYRLATRMQQEVVRVICETDPEPPSNAVNRVEDVTRRNGTTLHVTPQSVAKTRGGAPQKLRRRLSGDLDNIVLKAMQKLPRRRYASAEQMAEDLQRHLDGLPVLARPDSKLYRLRKFVRRNRIGVGAAVAIFLALILGVSGTTWQWRVADQQRRRADDNAAAAERRAEQFGRLVDAFVAELQGELRKVEGATAARKVLATTALQAAERLQQEGGDDRAVQHKLAEVCLLAGDVLGGLRSGNEGAAGEALESYARAHALLRELVDRSPDDRDLKVSLAKSFVRMGDISARLSQAAESLRYYQEAVNTIRGCCRPGSEDTPLVRALGSALDDCADQLLVLRRIDEALACCREAQSIRETLLAASPQDPKLLRSVSISHNRLGKLYEDAGNLPAALEERLAARAIRRRLLGVEASGQSKFDLIIAQKDVGEMLRQLARFDEATVELEEALARARDHQQADPADTRALLALVRVELARGALHRDVNEPAPAKELCASALQHSLAAAGAGRRSLDQAYYVAKSYEGLAKACRMTEPSASLEHYREAVRVYGEVLQSDAGNLFIKGEQASLAADYAAALEAVGERNEALAQYEQALLMFRQLRERGPLNSEAEKYFEVASTRHAALSGDHP